MTANSVVVVGFFGTQLDAAGGARRWERWRPTVGLFQRDDLLVARLDLLCPDVDKAAVLVEDVARLSPDTQVVLHPFPLADPWDFEEVYAALHDWVRGQSLGGEGEDLLVHITTGSHVAQICLFLLTEARFLPGKLLQTSPPRGKDPPGMATIDLDLARYDRIAQRFDREQADAVSLLKHGIATRNEAFNRLIDQLESVAGASVAPILLTGPTGAGKSLLARSIHQLKQSRRQLAGAMVEVNCATLRGDQAMGALFGHRRGAFTGATTDRPGLLKTADGGLLFLDEIGELGADEQAMLLRALEEKRFLPLGADREVASDFQLIAGTNRDLRAAVRSGRFREDLLARIDTWHFALPGLAERREDIEPNLDFELEQSARRTGRRVSFNREARRAFLRFATGPEAVWSANFRDLNAAVVRMATLAPGGRIGRAEVDDEVARLQAAWAGGEGIPAADHVRALLGDRADELDRFDRVQLEDVLVICRSARSLSEAGRTLFAVSRTKRKVVNDADRLRKFLLRFDLTWADVVAPHGTKGGPGTM